MKELFKMPSDELEHKVFCILKKYQSQDIYSSPRSNEGSTDTFKYVQVKK